MTLELFLQRGFSVIEFSDYVTATLKTAVFGFIIGTVSSFLGYHTTGGSAGVGRTSTQSVVYSSIFLILANVVLVRTIFFFFPGLS
jgi:phospholipid/cholesterol/gamma-HCH transport system permease protein